MPLESLRGKEVALTGRLASMKRSEAVRRIMDAGGRHVDAPGVSTSLLVAGHEGHLTAAGGVTRNMLLFRELKRNGAPIRLIEETEFLRLLGAADELSDFSRLYTAAQVSRIIETPPAVVRSWLRKGLIRPARTANRLAWFEIKDILQACNLSRLTASGVPASQIRSSLEQIARWLPEGRQIMGRLDTFARRLRVKLADGGWADPSGQRLISFQPDAGAPGTKVSEFPLDSQVVGDPLSDAEDAEDRGDLAAAAEGYARVLESQPDAETFFSSGNILYQLAARQRRRSNIFRRSSSIPSSPRPGTISAMRWWPSGRRMTPSWRIGGHSRWNLTIRMRTAILPRYSSGWIVMTRRRSIARSACAPSRARNACDFSERPPLTTWKADTLTTGGSGRGWLS